MNKPTGKTPLTAPAGSTLVKPLNQAHLCLVTTSNATYDGLVTVMEDGVHLQVKLGFMGIQSFKFRIDSSKEICEKVLKMIEAQNAARS